MADERAIGQLVDYARTRPDAGVVGPRILNTDGTVQGSARRFPGVTTAVAGRSSWLTRKFPNNPLSRHNLPSLDGRTTPLNVDWVSGACMLVRRTAFEQVDGMDERFFLYWEDADLCRRLGEKGWRTVYFPGATIVHAGGRSSIHVYRESLAAFHAARSFCSANMPAGRPACSRRSSTWLCKCVCEPCFFFTGIACASASKAPNGRRQTRRDQETDERR